MRVKLQEEIPVRSSARLHGVKLSQSVFDNESVMSTPKKPRRGTKNRESRTTVKYSSELGSLEEELGPEASIKSGSGRAARTPSKPKPKAKARPQAVRTEGLPSACKPPSTPPVVGQGSAVTEIERTRTPRGKKRKSVNTRKVRKAISKESGVHSNKSKSRGVRVVVEEVRKAVVAEPLAREGAQPEGKEETSSPTEKRSQWLPKSHRRKFVIPRRRYARKSRGGGGPGILGGAVPMGLMAAGVVSGMLMAYFYPAFRELPNRMY
ncbi:hypothetical protein Pmar_PMAR014871 [Perkinsus marinus ATCC 50983]|uniref:Uncharacterized protein n=1 Tax=Perkinsus marinus (strain ATCC 50983 / TXsc) TaxID=423536 RepID=C5L548_PERM5|nr:hypothetical protein Pmar_PMAR014871 [Perkinsus marinus ATCC 50983]EER08107.1 hypothetical protein Pmar_PMAR014871 [Perkinsus marinus ATCC 50983]|eukprot:XP_002776291.1 hypothetical protein Pmar_PMAR014871 [Perkinsus marinus ATCC 50983]